EDLFAAVAVSGTASMFLAPVLLIGLFLGRPLPLWSYLVSFAAAMAGAAAYFFQASPAVIAVLGDGHKYERLLVICVIVLVVGFGACGLGALQRRRVLAAGE
ncbi:MAG: sodium:proline symporter, partial [Pseudomonadota bacterium]